MDYWKRLCPSHIVTALPVRLKRNEGKEQLHEHCQLTCTSTEGEFVVATRPIPEGTLILQEQPYVVQIHHDLCQTTCPNCLSCLKDTQLTPCRQKSCSWHLSYCSSVCESTYWFLGHMYVCSFRDMFWSKQSLLLAFQLWLMSSSMYQQPATSFSSSVPSSSSSSSSTAAAAAAAPPSSSSSSSTAAAASSSACFSWTTTPFTTKTTSGSMEKIESLVDNVDQHSESERHQYSQDAKALSGLFTFSVHDKHRMQQDLVRYQGVIRCNGFGIQRRLVSKGDTSSSVMAVKTKTVGTAIYPFASKFNHSCQPNVLALFLRNQIQLRTLDSVSAGQPLSISYGPLSANSPATQRQAYLLNHYFFECHCQACQVRVPDQSGKILTSSVEHIYLCLKCKHGKLEMGQSVCPQCNRAVDWGKARNIEDKIEKYKQEGKWEAVLRLQSEIYHHQALPIGKTYDKLAQLYYSMHQLQEAIRYCELSLNIVKAAYGESSPEAAEEMFKLCGLYITGSSDKTRARYWIRKTRDLYRLLGLHQHLKADMEDLQAMYNLVST